MRNLAKGEIEYLINRIIYLTKQIERLKLKEDFGSQYNQNQYKKYLAQTYSAKNRIIKIYQSYTV